MYMCFFEASSVTAVDSVGRALNPVSTSVSEHMCMEVLICGGCKRSVPRDLASLCWHPARVLSVMDVGDGLGKDLSIQGAVTGVQQSVLGFQLRAVGWHWVGCDVNSMRPAESPCCSAPEHV